MLAAGYLEDAERADHESDHERRDAACDQPDHQRNEPREDRDLGDRYATEGAGRALALRSELALAAPLLACGLRLAFGPQLAPLRAGRTRGASGITPLARAPLGLLPGHGVVRIVSGASLQFSYERPEAARADPGAEPSVEHLDPRVSRWREGRAGVLQRGGRCTRGAAI